MEVKMTERNIYSVVEDVKKTLESGKHYTYSEINKKVYDVCSLEITRICWNGEIYVCDMQAEDGFWCKLNELMTKADAENEKRKDLEKRKQERIKLLNGFIEEYKRQIKELEES